MPAVGAVGASARAGVHAFDSLPAELKVTPLAQQSRILAADGTSSPPSTTRTASSSR